MNIHQANESLGSGKKLLTLAISSVTLGAGLSVSANAQDSQPSIALEEVIVTARKTSESLQDVPISIQALNAEKLENHGVADFDDYALMLPSLSYQSSGPGLSQIYMRGASDGGDGNASGQAPSVAIYLDEQTVTAIGRNLDLNIYDVASVEALAGPQGTMYGASSQGGTLRIVTNKPSTEGFEAGVDLDYSQTSGGEDSNSVEGFVNLPLGDAMAIRLVGWKKSEGGYIDNVAGERSYGIYDQNSGLSVVKEDNADLVEDDFNDLDNTGARAALKVDLNDNWTVTASAIAQTVETEGVWFHDPENPNGNLGDLEIERFNDDSSKDEFKQYSLTLEGDLGFATLTYAGSMMDRDVEYNNDYSDYADYYSTSWIYYYSCEYYTDPSTTAQCTSNNVFYEEDNKYERTTHEVRLMSQNDGPLSYTVGFYMEELEHTYRQEWIMPGMAQGSGYQIFDKANLWYLTDQVRGDDQTAVFGDISYDLTDALTISFGARYFDNESTLKGLSGYGMSSIQGSYPALNVDSSVSDSDTIMRGTISYDVSDDIHLYATWSEGYRAGGLNRDETAVVKRVYKPDYLTNYEFGWKTTWADSRVRFNGAIYQMDWTDMQYTKFDSSFESPVGLTLNLGEAQIRGMEADLTVAVSEGLTISAAMAMNDATQSKDFVIGGNSSPAGTELPHVPELKYNLSGRYEFTMMGMDAHMQAAYAFVDDSYNDIFKYTGGDTTMDQREIQEGYTNLNMSAGLASGMWKVELYGTNLTDERAQITRFPTGWDSTISTNRPRTVGVRLGLKF